MIDSPIEAYLDELLRRTRADARATRRLLDEAADHLYAAAAALQEGGMSPHEAEAEAVRRFGPAAPLARTTSRRSLLVLVLETLRSALFLCSCGLIAIGVSGLVALLMNVWAGRSFVGGQTVFPSHGATVRESADDAVVLRVLAGLVGLLLMLGYLAWRRRANHPSLLPAGLVDALGAAAFAAGTALLAIASAEQAARTGSAGVGFALSGAVVALPATGYFSLRAVRALLPSRAVAMAE